MANADLKTKKNNASVKDYLDAIEDKTKRKDCKQVAKMMRQASGKTAKMWGTSIVGFGEYHYKYESGREGDCHRIGFSPRKQAITIYIMDGFAKYEKLMAKLGLYKTGKSCLYIKRLEDVDLKVLGKLIEQSIEHFDKKYGKG